MIWACFALDSPGKTGFKVTGFFPARTEVIA